MFSNAGLVFVVPSRHRPALHPIQRRLDELDLLDEETTSIGSAVFAAPPGCAERGCSGETLLT